MKINNQKIKKGNCYPNNSQNAQANNNSQDSAMDGKAEHCGK